MNLNKKRYNQEMTQMMVERIEEHKNETKNVIKRENYKRQFQLTKSEKMLEYMIDNQLDFEKKHYFVDRKITNKMADYGFVIYEDKESRSQRFVKVVDDLLIQIMYDIINIK